MQQWNEQPFEDLDAWRNRRFTGLGSVLVEEQFVEWLRSLAQLVLEEVLANKPTACYFLQKDPADSLHLPLLRRIMRPEYYLHIIRDGRDVAASLLSAHASWGVSWTPGSMIAAAAVWRRHVQFAREAANYGKYLEVRYEDLQQQPRRVVRDILDFIDLPVEDDVQIDWMLVNGDSRRDVSRADTALERCLSWGGEVVRRRIGVSEPVGFVGAGGGSWRKWPAWKHWLFNLEAGSLLHDLGYVEVPVVGLHAQQLYAIGRRLDRRLRNSQVDDGGRSR